MEVNKEIYQRVLENLYDGVYFVSKDRHITYWNKGAEQITGYRSDEVVGKSCHDHILAHVDMSGHNLCGSDNCPAVRAIHQEKDVEEEVYLYHKEGYRVRVFTRIIPVRDSSGTVQGSIEIFSADVSQKELAQRIKELEELSLIDALTKVGNRQLAEKTLHNQLDEFKRYGWQFGVIFIDIDNFKSINDRYGHDIGDKVLKMVAQTIQNGLRRFNIVCRWGGEEFLAIVVNISREQLFMVGERLRLLVEHSSLSIDKDRIPVTISLGATLVNKSDTLEIVVRRADQLMYQSKRLGRNRLSIDS